MKKLNSDFVYLKDMYNDDYYPRFLVDKVKDCIVEVVEFLEKEEYEDLEEVQEKLDEMTELERLQAENEYLRAENAILKKLRELRLKEEKEQRGDAYDINCFLKIQEMVLS